MPRFDPTLRLWWWKRPQDAGRPPRAQTTRAKSPSQTATNRLLILTHTHAACSVFADRTKGVGSRVEIRTIDSVIAHIASAYHAGLGLPADIAAWVRQRQDGYAELALSVAALLQRYPMIVASLAQRHRVVICDEHQDSSGEQHSIVMALQAHGARLRIFGDPMQKIFKERARVSTCIPCDWDALTRQAHAFEQLDFPHRWTSGCPGAWGNGPWRRARALKTVAPSICADGLPPSVTVVFAETSPRETSNTSFRRQDRRPIDAFERAQPSLLILTRYNDTARSFRGFFNRRIPLWEGHTRAGLEKLVDAIAAGQGDCAALAAAVVAFMGDVGKGFSPSAFGNRFEKEVADGCTRTCRGKPATIQELARFLVNEPDHCGVAKMLRRLSELATTDMPSPMSKSTAPENSGKRSASAISIPPTMVCGDYPPPDLFAAEAAGKGNQHDPQGEGPGVRQRYCHALRREELPRQTGRKMSAVRCAQPGKEPSDARGFAKNPSPLPKHLVRGHKHRAETLL